ncbi:MAG TPA: DNA repair protein RecN [Alphaproteobacteria bacterium]|nr:DNA repair protein RecN [Alphaproteobacteria bacterium]HAJ47518.1 DNA repair protein RecN [Alphaproteobacteria bacterium]
MLSALSIRDFVLIDSLDLELERGLNVLTGETGAGKSILLDALTFVLGGRSDRDTVRPGAPQATVTAVLEPAAKHPVRDMVRQNGFDADGALIVRRQVTAEGRARAHLNDQPVSAGFLRDIGKALVEIHGQHDDSGLLDPGTHRGLLDQFGGLADSTGAVALAYSAWRQTQEALEQARSEQARNERECEFLEHAVRELGTLDPQPGEETALASERTLLMAAEKISSDLADAVDAVSGGQGVDGRLNLALRRLTRAQASAQGLLDAAVVTIERALIEVSEARVAIEAAARSIGADARRLEAVETRLFSLRAAARKYGVPCEGLPVRLGQMRDALDNLKDASERIRSLEAQEAGIRDQFQRLGRELSTRRVAAGGALDGAVAKELAPLKLDKARFRTEVTPLELSHAGPHGLDRVGFTVSTNPGAPYGALNRIASGGELSRFSLALKVALASEGAAQTLIFDEIDRGVGGAVADAVGERLSALSRSVQVLVVTHAPQVAARGDHHYLIAKSMQQGIMRTGIRRLDDDARTEEVARMLAGAKVTNEARAAALALIDARASQQRRRKERR